MVSAELWTEVRISFAGTLIEVAHLRPGQSFTLGEAPEADLTHATPGLHRLVIATASGAVLERLGSGELVALGPGEWICVELGAVRIEVGCEPQLVPELGRRPVELGWWLSLVSTALVVVPFLILALGAAETVLPPIESDAAPYLAYTVRSEPVAEEPRAELRPRPPREIQRAPDHETKRRSASKPRDTPTAADQPDLSDTLKLARSRPGPPRELAPMLRRDGSPAKAARSGGVLGTMPEREELEDFVSVAAASFDPDVDDAAMWAAMTDGPIDTTIAGLELIGSGRGGGEASEVVRSGAPVDPPTLRARVVEPRIDGELGSREALVFASSLRDEWLACLADDGAPVEFEVRYTVTRDGRISAAEVPRKQLSSKARRCIVAALEGRAGPGPTKDGKVAAVVQRVEVR